METIKIGICDDMKADRTYLREGIEAYYRRNAVDCKIEEYSCGENLAAEYEEGSAGFLLLFLDIYMTGLTGMQTARKIREKDNNVGIIFTTSSPDFAVEGYEVKAKSYLLKPVSRQKLEAVLEGAMSQEVEERRRSLVLKSGGQQIKVYHREILYVESMRRELFFYLIDGSCIKTYGKLDDLEREMNNNSFLRCHQSYLINIHYIRSVGDGFVMTTGVTLPIRKREQKAIKDIYFKYVVERTLRG